MTEEIIIDGVNVAGCEQIFAQKKCALLDQIYCEDNPDCYYKQLKQAENTVNECHKYLAELEDKIESLEQKNKELKEKYSHVLELAKTNADSNEYCLQELEQENEELKERFEKRGELMCNCAKQRENYRSALEEINITVKQLLQGVTSNCINNTPYLTALSLIENKINEVLNLS